MTFSSAGSTDPDGTVVGYSWDFGDGSPASTAPTPATPTASATSPPTLTVTDDDGNHRHGHARSVDTVANQPPVARRQRHAARRQGPADGGLQLRPASVDNDGTITGLRLGLRDDGIVDSTDPNPMHLYATERSQDRHV